MWVAIRTLNRGRVQVSAGLSNPIGEVLVCLFAKSSETYGESIWVLKLEELRAIIDRIASFLFLRPSLKLALTRRQRRIRDLELELKV